MNLPKPGTQEDKVLQCLLQADGEWINKQVFVREMYLTQAGRAIWNLENKFGWKIQHSEFHDEHGFKSYRIVQEPQTLTLPLAVPESEAALSTPTTGASFTPAS